LRALDEILVWVPGVVVSTQLCISSFVYQSLSFRIPAVVCDVFLLWVYAVVRYQILSVNAFCQPKPFAFGWRYVGDSVFDCRDQVCGVWAALWF